MKQLFISNILYAQIPKPIIQKIYFILNDFPSPGILHYFLVDFSKNETTIDHLIPALKFHYKIIIAKKFPYSGIIYIIAFDNSQRIMMAQGEELDCDIDFEK